ncbi:MAG: GNAT family N-acetyltransferase [Chloroflexales bacterium]|nr:GNAT family N-acetyltransferase [Chloroflexales bacterium]
MQVICVHPHDDPRWEQLVQTMRSDVFHSPGWMRILTDTYGLEVRAYIVIDAEGRPLAGLPFCRQADIKGRRIVILPFSDYCDPVVARQEHWDCLVERLAEEQAPITIRCLHNEILPRDPRFALVAQAKWHQLDLRPDLDTLWERLPASAQRAIRKAQKSEIRVYAARDKCDLHAFFRLHQGVRKHKYHMLSQPYAFFERIWEQFIEREQGLLMLAKCEATLLGGTLFLGWKDGWYYKFNASAPEHLGYRPNDLIIWESMKEAKTRGYARLDFGLSDWEQEGLLRFKRKFATEEKPISFLRHEAQRTQSESEQAAQALIPQLAELFAQEGVPDEVTEQAGALLYRYFA